MVLDLTFIFIGCIIILSLIPLYLYRKTILKKLSPASNIDSFLNDLKNYLTANYPKIDFNFNILKKYEKEQDLNIKETLIIEELVKQFTYQEYELSTQKAVPKNMLWSGYEQNSVLQKDNHFPSDWAQRKKAAWVRDEGRCDRCGVKVDISHANAFLAKQMKDGGGFNLENIVTLCPDCSKVIKSSDLEKTKRDLNLLDKLLRKNHI